LITSFKDGEIFKEIYLKNKYDEKDLLLFIQLYFDDFNLSPNQNTKLSVVYFTIANLPPFMNSSRDNIYLLYIAKRLVLDKIKFEGLFENLFEEYERLLDPKILPLTDGYKLRINLETMVADNSGKILFYNF
jgi:hypothetical protein